MLGLGGIEILILLILGGGLVGVVLLVLSLVRRGNGRIAALEEEVRRLGEEIDRQRGRASS